MPTPCGTWARWTRWAWSGRCPRCRPAPSQSACPARTPARICERRWDRQPAWLGCAPHSKEAGACGRAPASVLSLKICTTCTVATRVNMQLCLWHTPVLGVSLCCYHALGRPKRAGSPNFALVKRFQLILGYMLANGQHFTPAQQRSTPPPLVFRLPVLQCSACPAHTVSLSPCRCRTSCGKAGCGCARSASACSDASSSGGTNGFTGGTRRSCVLCAKKHTRRRQCWPSLHSWLRYLRGKDTQYVAGSIREGKRERSCREANSGNGRYQRVATAAVATRRAGARARTWWGAASTQTRCARMGTSRCARTCPSAHPGHAWPSAGLRQGTRQGFRRTTGEAPPPGQAKPGQA